jgi:hypothetical protein
MIDIMMEENKEDFSHLLEGAESNKELETTLPLEDANNINRLRKTDHSEPEHEPGGMVQSVGKIDAATTSMVSTSSTTSTSSHVQHQQQASYGPVSTKKKSTIDGGATEGATLSVSSQPSDPKSFMANLKEKYSKQAEIRKRNVMKNKKNNKINNTKIMLLQK